MSQDIDSALKGWDFKPGIVQARLVQARDGRQVIQMRVDLGILQIEARGRPDGQRPHGHATYFDYLKQQTRVAARGKDGFTLSDEQCLESDREFVQFFHRRLCWLALHNYSRAIADADHTLAFMDFVKEHSPNDDFTRAHERYRGFVLFHRTQAAAALAVEKGDAEKAVDEIRDGLAKIRAAAAGEPEEGIEDDGMVLQLQRMEESLRKAHNIETTLQEQLEQAVAREDYEAAARLRDALKRRQ